MALHIILQNPQTKKFAVLNRCISCKSEEIIISQIENLHPMYATSYEVKCTNCKRKSKGRTAEEAIEKWNTS